MIVGTATVDVNADLTKLKEGLDKAKAASGAFVATAAKTFVGLGAAAAAAGVGAAALGSKLAPTNQQLKVLGDNTKVVTQGLTNMLGVLAKVGIAVATFAAKHPVAGTVLSTALLGGSPALAAATILATSDRSRSAVMGVGRGVASVGSFIARNPLTALGVGGIGLAAIGMAAKAGAEGFEALKEAFQEARKASVDLKTELETLKTAAEKYTTDMPVGDPLTAATLRRLGGITGGLTSPFAQLTAGSVRSDDLEDVDRAIQELTLRFRDHGKAAQTLAVALRDPARGWRLLRDAGFEFTREQVKMLEGAKTFEERLEAAGELIGILNSQVKVAKQGGFIEFMGQLGTFLGKAPGAIGAFATSAISDLVAAITKMSGLDFVIKKVDDAFRSLGEGLQTINRQWFPSNAREELEGIAGKLADIQTQMRGIENSSAMRADGQGFFSRIFGAPSRSAAESGLTQLRMQRQMAEAEQERIAQNEINRLARERERIEQQVDNRLQDRNRNLRDELEMLQAGTRARVEGRSVAAGEGVDEDDSRIREHVRLLREIERARRAIASAGQLSVFERENAQLTQQIQLFRFGNEEMELRGRLLQIEMQALQRRQPLDEAQKNALLERMRALKQIQDQASTITDAFSSMFNSLGDALAQFATTGKLNFKELADNIVQQMIRIAIQAYVIKPIMNMISGFVNPAVGGSVVPGSTTTPFSLPNAGGFAAGGSFSVPEGGSGDRPFLIGLSSGERVDVTPAGSSRKGGSGGNVTVMNTINSSREFESRTEEREGPGGERIVETVFSEVMKRVGRGDADGTFGARFGMRPRTTRR